MAHFTFRTTRKTEFLTNILTNMPRQDRSDFIRERIILGMKFLGELAGASPASNVSQMSHKHDTSVPQMSDISVTNVSQDTEDLDSKLDNMWG